jgi:hypothetical protein
MTRPICAAKTGCWETATCGIYCAAHRRPPRRTKPERYTERMVTYVEPELAAELEQAADGARLGLSELLRNILNEWHRARLPR